MDQHTSRDRWQTFNKTKEQSETVEIVTDPRDFFHFEKEYIYRASAEIGIFTFRHDGLTVAKTVNQS